jgi:hypothetical protein
MSRWTHAICDDCWDVYDPGHLSPRQDHGDDQTCCYCGTSTRSGLYVRADPAMVFHCQHSDEGSDRFE